MIREAKKQHTEKLPATLKENIKKHKTWYQIATKFLNSNSDKPSSLCLETEDTLVEAGADIAEVLNKYFAKQSTLNDKHASLPEFEPPNHPTLESIRITEQDVKDAISVLQCNKASGPDQVSPKLIKKVWTNSWPR